MKALGYDIFWIAAHHFQHEGYECIPHLLMFRFWLPQYTTRLKFGCSFNVLPMWHLLRLAEDCARAEILMGGRVIV
jgi:alkanesulfonate monooxygenase SsuD/methylene tetrahydromethanopterin reductase-like flavin-dependent oxidoreductase (luciferase family)